MARPKEFDESKALREAMMLFWEKGYEATSMRDLMRRMQINRASLYGTYGDKRALFLRALQEYEQAFGYRTLLERARQGSPIEAIKSLFAEIIRSLMKISSVRKRGCLIQNTALELSPHDLEVGKRVKANFELCHRIFAEVLQLARKKGELHKSDQEIEELGIFLFANLSAIRSLAKVGMNESALRAVATNALRALD
jgi:TetR/AcrR family transcriptional repressor of nem operon